MAYNRFILFSNVSDGDYQFPQYLCSILKLQRAAIITTWQLKVNIFHRLRLLANSQQLNLTNHATRLLKDKIYDTLLFRIWLHKGYFTVPVQQLPFTLSAHEYQTTKYSSRTRATKTGYFWMPFNCFETFSVLFNSKPTIS